MSKPLARSLPPVAYASMDDQAVAHLPLFLRTPGPGDDVVHTGDLTGALIFDGLGGTDTLVVDHVEQSGVYFQVALNVGFTGTQFDGSAILNFENLTAYIGQGQIGRIVGDSQTNVVTVVSEGYALVLDGYGDDLVFLSGRGLYDAFAGNDIVFLEGPLTATMTNYAGSGNDTFYFGEGRQTANYWLYDLYIDGDDRILGFDKGEDSLDFQGMAIANIFEVNGTTVFSWTNSNAVVVGSVTVDAVGLVAGVDYFIG